MSRPLTAYEILQAHAILVAMADDPFVDGDGRYILFRARQIMADVAARKQIKENA